MSITPIQIQQAFWENVELLQYRDTTYFQTYLLPTIAVKKRKNYN